MADRPARKAWRLRASPFDGSVPDMPITLRWLLVVLAVWRLSHLLSAED